MVLVYLLWMAGFIFGILFLIELGQIIFKLSKNKKDNLRRNIILGAIFLILSFTAISSNILIVADKIIHSGISYEKVSDAVIEAATDTAEKSANSIKNVWDNVMDDKD